MKDEIKVVKAIEEELAHEQEEELSNLVGEEIKSEEDSSYDNKAIGITIVVIIGIFALTFGGFKFYNGITSAAIIDVDQLHLDNLDGDLDEEEGYIYNGFSFVLVDGLWWTEVTRGDTLTKIPLHFGPKEIEHIPITGKLSTEFNSKPIHIAIDPEINYNKFYTLSLMEMNNNIVQGTLNTIVTACNKEHEVCEDRPIVECNDPKGRAVINLVVAEEAKIELKGTCIEVSGSEYELVKAVDRLLLHWYGVMD
jgi:hypothetical protein